MLKKTIGWLLIVMLSITCLPAVGFASSTEPSKWAEFAVNSAISKGLVPARLQSSYQDKMNRDEFAELLTRTLFTKLRVERIEEKYWDMDALLQAVTLDEPFTDTTKDYVKAAFIMGTVNGTSTGKFSPNQPLTRQEAATMLINTVHYSNRTQYMTDAETKYQDLAQISPWALPAVKLAKSMRLMEGNGTRFNPKGQLTREEAIALALGLYNNVNYDTVTLRGNIPITAKYSSLRYNVSKDYVQVSYPADNMAPNDLVNDMRYNWSFSSTTEAYKNQEVSTAQASIVYLFASLKTGIPAVIEATVNKQPIAVDYGYMTMETLTGDYLMTFRFQPITGYMSRAGGYTYGYPDKVEVEPKVIPMP